MIKYIETDELYPFYTISDYEYVAHEIGISEEDLDDYENAMARFWHWQKKLGKLVPPVEVTV